MTHTKARKMDPVFRLAADARVNGHNGEFVSYLVDQCFGHLRSLGHIPDRDEYRCLLRMAKEPVAPQAEQQGGGR